MNVVYVCVILNENIFSIVYKTAYLVEKIIVCGNYLFMPKCILRLCHKTINSMGIIAHTVFR
jgi:hypothetical protein